MYCFFSTLDETHGFLITLDTVEMHALFLQVIACFSQIYLQLTFHYNYIFLFSLPLFVHLVDCDH